MNSPFPSRPPRLPRQAHDSMLERAERDMFQEGYELADCR